MINFSSLNTEQYLEYIRESENGKIEDFENVRRCEDTREEESDR
jgi:hypothetical protein